MTDLEVVELADGAELVVIEINRDDSAAGAEVVSVSDTPISGGGGGTGGPQSFQFSQRSPASVWLIIHPLPFSPSGIEVYDDVDGHRMYPARIVRPAVGRVRLDFTRPVAGTAYLS